mmetsp:Transcript_32962/g.84472  ORF Transcript_32962/g.84472 Transcript_32962/m.84472 type:complete len:229 (+) Transcript_32962:329-1015(+)
MQTIPAPDTPGSLTMSLSFHACALKDHSPSLSGKTTKGSRSSGSARLALTSPRPSPPSLTPRPSSVCPLPDESRIARGSACVLRISCVTPRATNMDSAPTDAPHALSAPLQASYQAGREEKEAQDWLEGPLGGRTTEILPDPLRPRTSEMIFLEPTFQLLHHLESSAPFAVVLSNMPPISLERGPLAAHLPPSEANLAPLPTEAPLPPLAKSVARTDMVPARPSILLE